ncbi:MAG: hypothetical protein ABW195_16430 [Ilumatobacteraceae bacterium]
MSGWLDPVAAALGELATPCQIFFRDDDAGWADDALWALLDEFAAAGVAVDVAAIPQALSSTGGRRLVARVDDGSARVHQHGLAHVDHEPGGQRKCEFGAARPFAAQRDDIVGGRRRLEDTLGRAIDPVFTPPWNRCTTATADAALAAGHRVLSRDRSAGRIDHASLAEIPVAVDWSARPHGVARTPDELGRVIAAAVVVGGPVGVMLHHAVMGDDDRRRLGALLALVASSPAAVATTIMDLYDDGGEGR